MGALRGRTAALSTLILLGAAAACTDEPTGIGRQATARAAAPALSSNLQPCSASRVAMWVNVKDYGAVGDGNADDTDEIRAAVAAGMNVYFPAGTYNITGSICLPAATLVTGDGADVSKIKASTTGDVFYSAGSAGGHTHDVTVEKLGFVATQGAVAQHALVVISGRNVVFQDNKAWGMSLIRTDVYLPCDQEPDGKCYGNKSPVTESHLTHGVKVLRNVGSGPGLIGGQEAIHLNYTKDVEVTGNDVRNYLTGLTWWGGNADPKYDGNMGSTRWAQNLLIQNNQVHNVVNGIWGSRGDSIHVYWNTVSECSDVCLDAEGSSRVLFWKNTATNAAGAVLAAFFNNEDVVFDDNRAYQNKSWGHNYLFRLMNESQETGNVNVTLRNNTLEYTGPGVGEIRKESSRYFWFTGNTVRNAVFHSSFNNAGSVRVAGSSFTFDRSTGSRPAIHASNNYMTGGGVEYIVYPYALSIEDNYVSGGSELVIPGVLAEQVGVGGAVSTWIKGNQVFGFNKGIEVRSPRSDHYFRIQSNITTGGIHTNGTNAYVTY